MSPVTVRHAGLSKEVRALAAPWLISLGVMVLAGFGVSWFHGFGEAAYFAGTAGLGALSIGHEYSNRTLPMLLAQPVRREWIFLRKWIVLALMLLVLNAVAAAFNVAGLFRSSTPTIMVLPILCGLFVAPWLTMLCRNPLAGAVFAFGLPGTIFTAGQVWFLFQTGHGPSQETARAILFWGTLAPCAIGAVMSWRTFMRLEAIDGGRDRLFAGWLQTRTTARTTSMTRRNCVWLLVRKEFGLQQMALVIGALHVVGWISAMVLRDRFDHVVEIFTVISFLYGASTCVVIGALASAEERRLGTFEWQAILPVSSATQWAVKVGVVWTLTLVQPLVLPSLLIPLVGPPPAELPLQRPEFAAGAAVLAAAGLYVSSMSTSGLRAVVWAVPAGGILLLPVSTLVQSFSLRIATQQALHGAMSRVWIRHALEWLPYVVVIAVLLRFASANHRSSETAGRHLWWQMAFVGICLSVSALVAAAVSLS